MFLNNDKEYKGRIVGIIIIFFLLTTSCSLEDSELADQINNDNDEIVGYLEANNIDATKDNSGIYYEELTTNSTGTTVNNNDVLYILYSMRTLDGTLVEESSDSIAIPFYHNYQSVIPLGLDYGVQLMKNGEKFRFYIPSTLAYEEYNNTSFFGPFTNFIMDVELVEIKSKAEVYLEETEEIQTYLSQENLDEEGSIETDLYYKETQRGNGKSPSQHSTVTINFVRKYLDGTIIEQTNSSPITFQLNNNQAVEGLERGILKMREGGKALLIMPSRLGFDESLQVFPTALRANLIRDNLIFSSVRPFHLLYMK
ncbi:FKBP-type peptidyl-prolyl cis-trans isomerase [Fulvivirga maritima]|uniref:FKBP-type peptidyl-prolyl cis-trans isomerase n=1 Tax=Fulvivirga maritima TaxID=2904247 RepID=UPI001F46549A|nr:FKBP-type peptidyl-prolyl cis-trans isomerase [Fulvivirga maritima]UII29137.1 FKBP-type peptidyl-prolyl cis-trans isomerase [Fulvivirga maritima]